MNRLLLMRHAKSDWNTDASTDFDRPLNKRGERDAPRMGKWLKQNDFIPNRIISSPSQRTRQTAYMVCAELDMKPEEITWVKELYEASLSDLLSAIDTNAADVSCLLLISHNPGLDQVLCHLCMDEPRYTASAKLMTTASVAVLSYENSPISTTAGSANLEILRRPKEHKQKS